MQDARFGWAVVAALVVVASACGAGAESRPNASHRGVSASSTREAPEPDPIAVPSTVAPPGDPAPATTPTTTVAPPPSAAAQVAPAVAIAPLPPAVTLAARADAGFTQSDDRPCSGLSSRSVARGQFEVRRTGPTGTALVVHYGATGTAGDYLPLPGQVTIPAGASSAVILVDPDQGVGPAPVHVHRSSVLRIALAGSPGYAVGGAAAAAITLRFDVDVFGCNQRLGERDEAPAGLNP